MLKKISIDEKFGAALLSLLFLGCLFFSAHQENVLYLGIPFVCVIVGYMLLDLELPFKLLLLSIPISVTVSQGLPIELDVPDEALQLVLTFTFLFYFIRKRETYTGAFIKHPFIILILLSFGWTLVTTIFSTDVAMSAKFLMKKVWFLIPFVFFAFGFFQDKKKIAQAYMLMYTVLMALVLSVLYKAKGVGFTFEDVHDPIQPFFKNHVMYGSMISAFFPLILGAWFISRRGSTFKFVLLISLLIFLTAIYFAYSRAAWGATLFALGCMFAVRIKKMHWAILVFYLLVASFVGYMINDSTYLKYRPKFERTIMHDDLGDHLMATIQGTDISSAERYYRWIASVRMSNDYPITGVGPNMFYDNYKPYTISIFKTWVSRNMERSTTHNYFLFMLVEQGWPAMILYAVFIFMIFYRGQQIYHRQEDPFYRKMVQAILGMIGAIFINNFFSELLETDKIGSLFFIGVTLLVFADLKTNENNKKYRSALPSDS